MSESVSEPDYGWVHPAVLSDLRDDGRLSDLDSAPIVPSFTDAYDRLSAAADSVFIPKDCVDDPEEYGFETASLAVCWGALETYRDQFATHSVQLWEYERYYLARLNQYNPDRGRLLEHALTDKLHYTVGAGVAAFTAYELFRARQSDD